MLVQCANCGVSFDPEVGRCLVCGAHYIPTREETIDLYTRESYRQIKSGVRVAAIRDQLSSDFRLSDHDADEVIRKTKERLREESRQHGRHLVVSGFLLLAIAAGVSLFTAGFVIATGCLGLGGAMVSVGTVKRWTGWNITGHDDE